jgi:hypothetical protein
MSKSKQKVLVYFRVYTDKELTHLVQRIKLYFDEGTAFITPRGKQERTVPSSAIRPTNIKGIRVFEQPNKTRVWLQEYVPQDLSTAPQPGHTTKPNYTLPEPPPAKKHDTAVKLPINMYNGIIPPPKQSDIDKGYTK